VTCQTNAGQANILEVGILPIYIGEWGAILEAVVAKFHWLLLTAGICTILG
jgi:hypothetical protein